MDRKSLEELIESNVEKALQPYMERAAEKSAVEKFFSQVMEEKQYERGSAKHQPGNSAARFIRCLAAARGDAERASRMAEKWGDEAISKALGTADQSGAGVLVPEEMSTEIIELLRPRAVVRGMNPVIMPMDNGVMTVPKQTGGATASYIGESQAQNASQPSTGQLRLTWKKLKATVPVSNELLQFSNPSADTMVRNDMVSAMAIREDKAFIRDDGSEDKPRGLRYWVPSGNVISSSPSSATAPTVAEVEAELTQLLDLLEGADVRMINPGWMMAPRTKNYLLSLRDAGGNRAFPSLLGAQPTLWGYPVGVSNNIPRNLGGGDESELYLVDFADAVIGESSQLSIEISNEASYTDASGTLVSAFDRDETVVKAIMRHDFVMRHDESVAVLDAVRWGAV